MIYLGCKAVEQSLLHKSKPQRRLDSLKRRLTSGDLSDLKTDFLDKAFNRTGIEFSNADAMTLMYSHILYLTHEYLADAYGDEILNDVKYRFTRPVFDVDRAGWFDNQVVSSLSEALSINDQQKLDLSESVSADDARKLLMSARRKKSGCSEKIHRTGFLEPIAAGMLHLSRFENRRLLAAIMDIGAGTTDMAMFVSIQPDGKASIDRVMNLGQPISINKAGDHIDDLLRMRIKKDAVQSKEKLSERDRIEIDLNIRRWKKDLFDFGEAIPTLSNGRVLSRITRHSFLSSPEYEKMKRDIIDALFSLFQSASKQIDFFATARDFPASDIELIPAGGGARLPIFEEIGKKKWQTSRPRLGINVQEAIPDEVPGYDDEYPQLSVALGGAHAELPNIV
ncbi:MAG TPA: hypothetical protein PKD55_02615 [Bellilinea sp.]|nr:hypothetical protein [Bellilinea sp.]